MISISHDAAKAVVVIPFAMGFVLSLTSSVLSRSIRSHVSGTIQTATDKSNVSSKDLPPHLQAAAVADVGDYGADALQLPCIILLGAVGITAAALVSLSSFWLLTILAFAAVMALVGFAYMLNVDPSTYLGKRVLGLTLVTFIGAAINVVAVILVLVLT